MYQKAMERAVKRAILHDEAKERKRARKQSRGLSSTATTPPTTVLPSPSASRRASFSGGSVHAAPASQQGSAVLVDEEKGEIIVRRKWWQFGKKKVAEEHEKIRPGWRDINPFPIMLSIFSQPTNAVVLFASGESSLLPVSLGWQHCLTGAGILFSAQYTIVYTAAVTLAAEPYSYNALNIGLVILSFGAGSMAGSLGGGKYSDVILRRLKTRNGGVSVPEVSPNRATSRMQSPLMPSDAFEECHPCDTRRHCLLPGIRLDSREEGTYQCDGHHLVFLWCITDVSSVHPLSE